MSKLKSSIFALLFLTSPFLFSPTDARAQTAGDGSSVPEASPTPAKKPARRALNAEKIAKLYLPSVVLLEVNDGKKNASLGSGFFIGKTGYILTNYHVIEGMIRGTASYSNEQSYITKRIEKIVAFDKDADLAMLRLEGVSESPTPGIKWAKTAPKIGESVYVLGNPEGLTGSISEGIISSSVRGYGKDSFLQITAAISSGSSGGPVFNKYGEAIGVVARSLKAGQNLNFAIPLSVVDPFTMDALMGEAKYNDSYAAASRTSGSWLILNKIPDEDKPSPPAVAVSTLPKPGISPSAAHAEDIKKTKALLGDMTVTVEPTLMVTMKLINVNYCTLSYWLYLQDPKYKSVLKRSEQLPLKLAISADLGMDERGVNVVTIQFSKPVVRIKMLSASGSISDRPAEDMTALYMKDSATAIEARDLFNNMIGFCKQSSK